MNKLGKILIITVIVGAGVLYLWQGAKKNSPLKSDSIVQKIESGVRPAEHYEMVQNITDFDSKTMRQAVALPKKPVEVTGEIKVAFAKLNENLDTDPLLSTGIPFAPGQLRSIRDFVFFDNNGIEIPLAAKELARWPQDNSIRSVLVQFRYPVKHLYEYATMKWGVPRQTLDMAIVEPDWEYPEGMVVMPAQWLSDSEVVGEQVPWGKSGAGEYDENILKYFPEVSNIRKTENLREYGYYSTPHVFYQLFVRTGELDYFLAARRELLFYRNHQLIQEGEDRGRYINDPEGRYVYVEAMADDYFLTGDPRSLEMAGYMAEYLNNYIKPEKAFYPKNAQNFFTERHIAFPLIGILSYYEMTLDKKYLKIASEYINNLYKTQLEWPDRGGFIHNLYAHDPEEGARKDEYGGSPFMTGLLLEGIIKYHKITGSAKAADSIFRAADWLIEEGLVPAKDAFMYLTADAYRDGGGDPDVNLLIVHGLGYAYRLSGYQYTDYLNIAQKVFARGIEDAFLDRSKHFNQNYRSSGHYLAYIKDGLEQEMRKRAEHRELDYQQIVRKDSLYSEDFEFSFGKFNSPGDTSLKLDSEEVYKNGKSLQVKSRYDLSTLSAGFEIEHWSMADYPKVSFSYKIPQGDPVGVRVRTAYGDWICLAGTNSYKCGNPLSTQSVELINDGQWHEVDLDAKIIVQGVLSAVEKLSQFEFYTNGNAENNDLFWIDDFKIGK